jgi:hypothetical protein
MKMMVNIDEKDDEVNGGQDEKKMKKDKIKLGV